MELLFALVWLCAIGFVIGALARFAVPGPDPLPVWATIVLGLVGAFLGSFAAGIVLALLGGDPGDEESAALTTLFAAPIGAIVLLVLYRRFVQKRPITGPEAQRMPLRPRGLRRIVTRRPHRFLKETEQPGGDPADQLRKLVLLRDAGKIDAAEFERRKAALVERI